MNASALAHKGMKACQASKIISEGNVVTLATRKFVARLLVGSVLTSPFIATCAFAAEALPLAEAGASQASATAHLAEGSASVAEGQPSDTGLADIVVTARRRSETTLDTPVAITAFSGEQLARAGVIDLTDVAKITPQLVIAPNVGPYGGSLTLRGVASPTATAAAEPAVTVNLDGVPISFGGVVRLGQFDIGQIEVLKGPQALFFGKNSSGGIIALKSADPKDIFEASFTAAHEMNASQIDVEAVVSGPITSTLRGRLAGRYSVQDGYFRNVAPSAFNSRTPGTGERGIRGTLIWEPSDAFTAKIKGTYDDLRDSGAYGLVQRISCPAGGAAGGGVIAGLDDCRANGTLVRGDNSSNVAAVSGNTLFGDGRPYTRMQQALGVLDVTYRVVDGVQINAISGYYNLDQKFADDPFVAPIPLFQNAGHVKKDTFTQELRLSSDDAASAFTWMLGGFYQSDKFSLDEQYVRFAPPSTLSPLPRGVFRIDSKSYSGFGQASYKVLDKITLSGGVRYTHETKKQSVTLSPKFIPEIDFDNWSPEATISYKPDENVNFYASYKQGYKSGSFQVGTLSFLSLLSNAAVTQIDSSYKAETVSGFEGGVKASLLDHQLRLNLGAYSYKYKNLQLSSFDPSLFITRILNAASSRVQGVEADLTLAPRAVPGLRLFAAASYNRARYLQFVSGCYTGQTPANGCTIDGPDADTVPDQQDLSGRTLPRAPQWAGNIGGTYETSLGSALRLTLNASGNYTSFHYLSQELTPGGSAKERFLIDAGVAIGSQTGSWEIAFLGKNLTNRYYGLSGYQQTGTGSGTGTAAGIASDFNAVVSRGRELWLRLTIKPNLF